jgi:SAM-dependent methyltransferase
MSNDTISTASPVRLQDDLWGERAQDWADVMEGWDGWGLPLYRHVLERISVTSRTRLVDVGCGAGRFCRIAADRGADVAGLDASDALVEIARGRVPRADLQVGDMGQLPWADGSFDVVTGFNSFFLAGDMVAALREARRVARPGAVVATTVFGRPDRCESTPLFASLARFAPPGPDEVPADDEAGSPLYEEGVLEAVVTEAGLTPSEAGYVEVVEHYPDLATMVRGYAAAAPFVLAARRVGTEAVHAALSEAMRGLQHGPTGGCRLVDEARYIIATA